MATPEHPDHSASSGSSAAVFAGYRRGMEEVIGREDRRIGVVDLAMTLGGLLAAVGFCFVPWMTYQQQLPDTNAVVSGEDTGWATDGWVLLGAAIIAVIAFLVAARQADQAMAATVGFFATVIVFLSASTTWLLMDMAAPPGATDVRAAWGVMAATGASAVALGFAYRVRRTARIY